MPGPAAWPGPGPRSDDVPQSRQRVPFRLSNTTGARHSLLTCPPIYSRHPYTGDLYGVRYRTIRSFTSQEFGARRTGYFGARLSPVALGWMAWLSFSSGGVHGAAIRRLGRRRWRGRAHSDLDTTLTVVSGNLYRLLALTTAGNHRCMLPDGGRVPSGPGSIPFDYQGAPCADGRHHRHWSGTQGWRIREFQVQGAGYMR
jgi:hypothetical protein